MLYYINGVVAILEENLAVMDCGGVGFACNTTTYTLTKLTVGQQTTLYTHCNIREDAFDIYGFCTKDELNCFQMLLGVSGVGPKAALSILSAMTPERLSLAVLTEDEKLLTTAQGVGKKMAQRVILELKDKLGAGSSAVNLRSSAPVPVMAGKATEAAAALSALGYAQSEISAALRGIQTDTLPVEEIVRQALRAMLGK